MADPDGTVDYYVVIGVAEDADVNTIRTAYRKASLKVHPDKNPNKEAAQKFFELTQAYEILLDPIKRAAFDAKRAARAAHSARFANLDHKRKELAQDLAQREASHKRHRQDTTAAAASRAAKLASVKADSVRLRQSRADGKAAAATDNATQTPHPGSSLSGGSSALRIKWVRGDPALLSGEDLRKYLINSGVVSDDDFEMIVMAKSDSSAKRASAVALFTTPQSAARLYEYSVSTKCWPGVTIAKLEQLDK